MMQADQTIPNRVIEAVSDDLVGSITEKVKGFDPVAQSLPANFRIGDIEDLNVLIQNSLWLNVPVGYLDVHEQVKSLRDRAK